MTFDISLIIFFHHQSSLEDFAPFICQVFPILIMSLKAASFHVCGLYYMDQEAPLWAAKAHLYRYGLQFDRADCLKRFIMVTSQQDASIYHSVCMYVCSWHPWAGWILIWPIVSGWVAFLHFRGKKPLSQGWMYQGLNVQLYYQAIFVLLYVKNEDILYPLNKLKVVVIDILVGHEPFRDLGN